MRTLTALPLAVAAGVVTFFGVLSMVRREMRREREKRAETWRGDVGVN